MANVSHVLYYLIVCAMVVGKKSMVATNSVSYAATKAQTLFAQQAKKSFFQKMEIAMLVITYKMAGKQTVMHVYTMVLT